MLIIKGKSSCRECGGAGRINVSINLLELIESLGCISDGEPLEPRDKIPAIKLVRKNWDLGLKQAKEVVEAYQEFTANLSKSLGEDLYG